MATTYNTCLRQIAVSVNAVTGTTPALLETSYSTVPLTSSNFQSSILPFTSLKDKMLNAQGKIITAAAYQGDHPYRAYLTSQTSALTYGALIPSTDSGGTNQIIGVYGTVRDNSGSNILTKGNLSQIRARVTNPNTMFLVDVPLYAIDDRRIYHTTTSVVIDVVTYTRPSADSLTLTSNILLPDDAVPAIVNGALEECMRDDEFLTQAQRFGGVYEQWLATAMRTGSVDSTSAVVEKAA